jgi:hypothetical protein
MRQLSLRQVRSHDPANYVNWLRRTKVWLRRFKNWLRRIKISVKKHPHCYNMTHVVIIPIYRIAEPEQDFWDPTTPQKKK